MLPVIALTFLVVRSFALTGFQSLCLNQEVKSS